MYWWGQFFFLILLGVYHIRSNLWNSQKIIVLATIQFLFQCFRNDFLSCSNKLKRFCTCQKQLNSYWKKWDGSICKNVNAMCSTEISPSLRCKDSQGWTSFAAIEENVASCEPWPWLTYRFTMAIAICSIDSNTTFGHLSREFSWFHWIFLTHRGEMNVDSLLHNT